MKDNFFVKFKNCLHRLDKFPRYIDQGVFKAIKYGFLISLIFGGIIGIYNCVIANAYINTGIQSINKPEYAFTINNNTLTMKNNPIKIKQNGNMIYVNDKETLADSNEIMNNYVGNNATMLILKDGIDIHVAGIEREASYNDISTQIFNSKEINNSTLSTKIQEFKKYFFSFQFILNVLERFVNLIMDSFLIALIGMVFSMFLGMMVKPSALYSLSIYAATVPFLISLPISILYPSINLQMPLLIATAIYVVIILKFIKNDLVRRQTGKNESKKTDKFL